MELGTRTKVIGDILGHLLVQQQLGRQELEAFDFDTSEDNAIPAKYMSKLLPAYYKTRFEALAKLRAALSAEDFSHIKALAHMLARLSAFAAAAGPRLQSIDLNPVFAMPEGHGAFAVDAVIEVTR